MSFRLILFLAFIGTLLCNNTNVSAQYHHQEIGAWVGISNYFGDINTNYSFKKVRPSGGIVYRYHVMEYIAIKGSASYASIGFEDADSPFPYQQARNLSFRSNIIEASALIELNFKKFVPGSRAHSFTPYLTAGIGFFHHNPKAKIDGEWYRLKLAGTEGQNESQISGKKPYKSIQMTVPAGFGFKWWMKGPWTMSAEAVYRSTFTDYIDDVSGQYVDNLIFLDGSIEAQLEDRSGEVGTILIGDTGQQRGDSSSNDGYLFVGVSFTYTLFANKCPSSGSFRPKRNIGIF